jgi:hypothetical protein
MKGCRAGHCAHAPARAATPSCRHTAGRSGPSRSPAVPAPPGWVGLAVFPPGQAQPQITGPGPGRIGSAGNRRQNSGTQRPLLTPAARWAGRSAAAAQIRTFCRIVTTGAGECSHGATVTPPSRSRLAPRPRSWSVWLPPTGTSTATRRLARRLDTLGLSVTVIPPPEPGLVRCTCARFTFRCSMRLL